MTTWVPRTGAGRPRGLVALGRAWGEVLVRPRRFFQTVVAPGEQAPGLTFAMAVVLVEETIRYLVTPSAVPGITENRVVAAVVAVAVAVVLITPAVLHLLTAIQTLLLFLLAPDRAGVSETVQILGYATAPCVAAGVPVLEVTVFSVLWGSGLVFVGLRVVHTMAWWRAIAAGVVPAGLIFGYGFRGFDALAALLAQWYII